MASSNKRPTISNEANYLQLEVNEFCRIVAGILRRNNHVDEADEDDNPNDKEESQEKLLGDD